MRNALIGAAAVLALALAVTAVVLGTGMYDVAADKEHSVLVYWLLEPLASARLPRVRISWRRRRWRISKGIGAARATTMRCARVAICRRTLSLRKSHHYHFRLAALDADLIDMPEETSAEELWRAVQPHYRSDRDSGDVSALTSVGAD